MRLSRSIRPLFPSSAPNKRICPRPRRSRLTCHGPRVETQSQDSALRPEEEGHASTGSDNSRRRQRPRARLRAGRCAHGRSRGRLDYAPVDIGALVVTRANENVPVKTISVVHQNTMSAILSLQESGLRRPQDLVGKTLADSPASTVRVLFPLYAKKAGIDPSRVTWRDAAPPALPALLASKQVDGIGQFVVGRPLIAAAAGKPVTALRYSDHLPGLLGIGIIASDDKIRSRPGEVRRFVRAINPRLGYALDNPVEAGRIPE